MTTAQGGGFPSFTKILSTCRTIVINLLNQLKPENRVAQLEFFSDDFNTLINWLKESKVL
jgi:hypothetical protein